VPHSMCGSGARWCARADAIFDVVGMHVLDVEVDDLQRLVLTVESAQLAAACPGCGVMAIGHGRRVRVLHDAPSFGRALWSGGWCGSGAAENPRARPERSVRPTTWRRRGWR
jgi:hypothetical protein